jgi:hypothetical protein
MVLSFRVTNALGTDQATPLDTFSSFSATDFDTLHRPPRPASRHYRPYIGVPYAMCGRVVSAHEVPTNGAMQLTSSDNDLLGGSIVHP